MLLACKYEEVAVPVVEDFVYISDKAYKRKEVLEMVTIYTQQFIQLLAPNLFQGQHFPLFYPGEVDAQHTAVQHVPPNCIYFHVTIPQGGPVGQEGIHTYTHTILIIIITITFPPEELIT